MHRVSGICLINRKRVNDYEIHMGQSNTLRKTEEPLLKIHQPGKKKSWEDDWCVGGGRVSGTYVHLHLDSNSEVAKSFIEYCRIYG